MVAGAGIRSVLPCQRWPVMGASTESDDREEAAKATSAASGAVAANRSFTRLLAVAVRWMFCHSSTDVFCQPQRPTTSCKGSCYWRVDQKQPSFNLRCCRQQRNQRCCLGDSIRPAEVHRHVRCRIQDHAHHKLIRSAAVEYSFWFGWSAY